MVTDQVSSWVLTKWFGVVMGTDQVLSWLLTKWCGVVTVAGLLVLFLDNDRVLSR